MTSHIGSGNGLVPSGNKPLPELMSIKMPYGITIPQLAELTQVDEINSERTAHVVCPT